MKDEAEKRGELIRHLEEALTLADEIEDGQTGFLIERALDHANLGLLREPPRHSRIFFAEVLEHGAPPSASTTIPHHCQIRTP